MPVAFQKQQKRLIARLSGEIDHHTASLMRAQIDRRIAQDKPEILRLNFKDVTFMDSSGVGLVMGRYRQMQPYGGVIELDGMSRTVERIMRLSGMDTVASVRDRKE